jgi:mRNA interferase RelE/StbE
MSFVVRVTPGAQKQIRKLDPQVARRIRSFLEDTLQGIQNPRVLGKPLVDQDFWRYRVGDYRILVSIQDNELLILVVAIAHRREIYRDL